MRKIQSKECSGNYISLTKMLVIVIESGFCTNGEYKSEKVHAALQIQHLEISLRMEFL